VVACPTTVLERGKSLRAGGAKYDFTGQQTIGTAIVGNSLFAVKQLVFEQKRISGEALLHALKTDFKDKSTDPTGDEIRHLCLNVPKYGNDEDAVDYMTRDALAYVSEKLTRFKNTRYGRGPIGGIMHVSTSTVSSHIPFGKIVGALPDGRFAGTPLSDGQSPMRGTDTRGPTAAVNSVAKLKNILLSCGSLYNMKFPPTELQEDGLHKFIALIDHYFHMASI
jgi:formate C-acetyltransferase